MSNFNKKDENIFDEKILESKIKGEQESLDKLKSEIDKVQLRKERIMSKMRTLTKKTKTLEVEISSNAMNIENFRNKRKAHNPATDKKLINKRIEEKCEELFNQVFEKVTPKLMQIEVEFEGSKTTFNVCGYADDDEDTDNEIEDSLEEKRFEEERDSINLRKKLPRELKTFEEMKKKVAPFFSLAADRFYFADQYDSIYLDNLPIFKTLFPLKRKIKNLPVSVKIILKNNLKFDEVIDERIREKENNEDNTKIQSKERNKTGLKESYENEMALKKAEAKRKKAQKYQLSKERVTKYKGIVSALLYVGLIVIWIVNLITTMEFGQTFMMKNSTNTFLDYGLAAPNQSLVYSKLSKSLLSSSPNNSTYAYLKMNYILPGSEIVLRRYSANTCQYQNSFIKNYKIQCLNVDEEDRSPYNFSGMTYYFDENPRKKAKLPVRIIPFDNSGYRLPIDFNDPDMENKIVGFLNEGNEKIAAINLAVYNPSLLKVSCIYRISFRYNLDQKAYYNYNYVLNVRKPTTLDKIMHNLVLVLAAVLVLSFFLSLFEFVPASRTSLDLDLMWLKSKEKKVLSKEAGQEGVEVKQIKGPNYKFYAFRFGESALKVYPPTFFNILSLLSVIIAVVIAAFELNKQSLLDNMNFNDGTNIYCGELLTKDFLINTSSSFLILLMMVVFLRYVAEFVHVLYRFVVMIQSLVKNTYTLGILICWIFLIFAIFGNYTFGGYFPFLNDFPYMYASLILLIMRKNVIVSKTSDFEYVGFMSNNLGDFPLVALVVFLYILLTFIILKIMTSIVIKSFRETSDDIEKEKEDQMKYQQEILTLIRDKAYEESKSSKKK